jgi:hypothetical protein
VAAARVTIVDWLLLGISLVFCAIGLLLLVVSPMNRPVAMMELVFSVPCALVFGSVVRRRFRHRRFNALLVSAAPGTELRMSVRRTLFMTAAVAIPAVAMLTVAPDSFGWGRYAVAAVLLALAAYLLVEVFSGRVSRTFLRFEPAGLRVGNVASNSSCPGTKSRMSRSSSCHAMPASASS